MKLRRLFCSWLFLLASTAALSAQTHLTVPIEDPIYPLIRVAEVKGILPRLSQTAPYTKSYIKQLLNQMWEKRGRLTTQEQTVLEREISRFNEDWREKDVWLPELFSTKSEEHPYTAHIGVKADMGYHHNLNEIKTPSFHTGLKFYLEGDISHWLSYKGVFGASIDYAQPDAFAPYSFTKEWDARHIGVTGESDWEPPLETLMFSYIHEMDITASFFDNTLLLQATRFRKEWGMGDGGFSLSGTARPFTALDLTFRPIEWVSISHIVGNLSDWYREVGGKYGDWTTDFYPPGTDPENPDEAVSGPTYRKNYTVQRLELFPTDWLYLSATGSVIWAGSFDLGYMFPLIFGVTYQNTSWINDNVAIELGIGVTTPHVGRFYGNLFVDEMQISRLETMLKDPRKGMVAIQAGWNYPVPKAPFTTTTLQYTKIEPYVYSHYETSHPDFAVPVDTTYTHDGENLGYNLPPNSDEIMFKIETAPLPLFRFALIYKLIRHGTNYADADEDGKYYIKGSVWDELIYSEADQGNYHDKNFLRDGVYDWNNIVTLQGTYLIPNYPVEFTASYTFAHTFWETNGYPWPYDTSSIVRNIIGFKVRIYY